ncbi:MAG: hypothetical protein QOJ88_39 [Pyrinomonadaceae bacterium]|jgi:hypothetical protein|nr:hypothetical protein [Pyrinomonadaceae bacterium]
MPVRHLQAKMKSLSSDTTPEAQRMHFELMRRLPGWKRLSLALELTWATRQLILADIRHHFPEADEAEIRRRFIARVLPRRDVISAYGFDPKDDCS